MSTRHDQPSLSKRMGKRKFITDRILGSYTQPKMVTVAQEMLCEEDLSEEAFLGAQAVLLLNGIL